MAVNSSEKKDIGNFLSLLSSQWGVFHLDVRDNNEPTEAHQLLSGLDIIQKVEKNTPDTIVKIGNAGHDGHMRSFELQPYVTGGWATIVRHPTRNIVAFTLVESEYQVDPAWIREQVRNELKSRRRKEPYVNEADIKKDLMIRMDSRNEGFDGEKPRKKLNQKTMPYIIDFDTSTVLAKGADNSHSALFSLKLIVCNTLKKIADNKEHTGAINDAIKLWEGVELGLSSWATHCIREAKTMSPFSVIELVKHCKGQSTLPLVPMECAELYHLEDAGRVIMKDSVSVVTNRSSTEDTFDALVRMESSRQMVVDKVTVGIEIPYHHIFSEFDSSKGAEAPDSSMTDLIIKISEKHKNITFSICDTTKMSTPLSVLIHDSVERVGISGEQGDTGLDDDFTDFSRIQTCMMHWFGSAIDIPLIVASQLTDLYHKFAAIKDAKFGDASEKPSDSTLL